MESNRDEAEKCLEIGKKYLRTGQIDKAKRMLEKCLRLFPLKDAAGLLEAMEKNGASAEAGKDNSRQARQRTKSEEKPEPREGEDYTKEEREAVNRIRNCKDFYEILNVSKDAGESELKKNYRKLALQFHPDKNKAPGATDAFKKIATAFAVLSDESKRRRYDEYGESMGPTQTHRREHNEFEREFEDISPEDIFNMFFGGGYPTGRVYVHRRNRANHHHNHTHFQPQREEQNVPAYYPIMQLLPIFILIAFSLLSSLLVQDPPYSFHQNGNYLQPRITGRYSIQYFVQKSFSSSYQGESLKQLERRIERDYIEKVQINCYKERQYKQEMLYQARVWGSHEMLRKAENLETRSCKQLEEVMAQ